MNAKTVETAIYRMKVEGKESLDAAARSVDGLAVSEERATKATRASQQGFDRLRASIDPAARAHQQYQAALEKVERFAAAGIGTEQQRAGVVAMVTQRYQQAIGAIDRHGVAANDNARKIGLNSHEMKNLGFQINDVATMLAMGASPFQIMASQGGQVLQILQGANGGISGALKDMGSRISGLLGPIGLWSVGFAAVAAAGYGIYSLVKRESPTLEKTLQEHARLIGAVKDAYKDAGDKAGKFYQDTKAVLTLQTELNINNLQQAVREQARQVKTGMGVVAQTFDPLGASLGGAFDTEWDSTFTQKFRKPLEALAESARNGVPDIMKFRDEVAKIALVDPGSKEKAAELLEMSQAAASTTEKLRLAEKALRLLQGKGTAADRDGLGLSNTKPTVNAYDELIKRTEDRIEQLELEGKTAGQTGNAVQALRLQHEAERAARKAGVGVDQEYLDSLKRRLETADRLAKLGNIRADIKFDRGLIGLSAEDAQIARQLQEAYPDIATSLGSAEAAQIRFNNAMRDANQNAMQFADTILQGLLRGESAMRSLTSAAAALGQRLASQGLQRLMGSGPLFGGANAAGTFSMQGGMAMLGAAGAGYGSGSSLSGALGGLMAGLSTGNPILSLGGAAVGVQIGAIGSGKTNGRRKPAANDNEGKANDCDQRRSAAAA